MNMPKLNEVRYGYDGKVYICVGISRSGNPRYMDVNDRHAQLEECKRSNYEKQKKTEPVVVDPVEVLPNKELDKVYRSMASHLLLEERHRKYLHEEGWTDEMIEHFMVVSFPESDFKRYKYHSKEHSRNIWRKALAKAILKDLGNPENGLKGVPGAYQLDGGNGRAGDWTFAGNGGIIFWQFDQNGHIYRARIRMDFRDVSAELHTDSEGEYFFEDADKYYVCMKGAYRLKHDGTKIFRKDDQFSGKYRNLASFFPDEKERKNNRIVNTYKNGCQSGNCLSYYSNPSRDDMFIAYVTEGEKKGAFAEWSMRAPFITLPGVDSWGLLLSGEKGKRPVDKLKESGCQVIVVAFDADKSKNKTVLSREIATVEALKKEGFVIGVAEWDISIGKGIDDLLAAGGKIRYVAV